QSQVATNQPRWPAAGGVEQGSYHGHDAAADDGTDFITHINAGIANRERKLLGAPGGLRAIDDVLSQTPAYDDDPRQEYQRSSIEVSEADPAKDRGGHTAEHCNGAAPDLVREPSPGGSGEKTHGRGDHDRDDTGRVIA